MTGLSGAAFEGAGMILRPPPIFMDISNILRPPFFGTFCPKGRGAWKEDAFGNQCGLCDPPHHSV